MNTTTTNTDNKKSILLLASPPSHQHITSNGLILLKKLMFGDENNSTNNHQTIRRQRINHNEIIRMMNELALGEMSIHKTNNNTSIIDDPTLTTIHNNADDEDDDDEDRLMNITNIKQQPTSRSLSSSSSILPTLSTTDDPILFSILNHIELLNIQDYNSNNNNNLNTNTENNTIIRAIIFILDLNQLTNVVNNQQQQQLRTSTDESTYMKTIISQFPRARGYVFVIANNNQLISSLPATTSTTTAIEDDSDIIPTSIYSLAQLLHIPSSRILITNIFNISSYITAWSSVIAKLIRKRKSLHKILQTLRNSISNASCVALVETKTNLIVASASLVLDQQTHHHDKLDESTIEVIIKAVDLFCDLEAISSSVIPTNSPTTQPPPPTNLNISLTNELYGHVERIEKRLALIVITTTTTSTSPPSTTQTLSPIIQQFSLILKELYKL
jgi:hypothetical protein